MTEDELERQCRHWFAEGGWKTAQGPDLAPDGPLPERADYRQMLLLANLEAAVRRTNPCLPESAVEQAAAALRTPESPDAVFVNRDFHRPLLDGVRNAAAGRRPKANGAGWRSWWAPGRASRRWPPSWWRTEVP
jgi:type I restriction enzyme R subunit